MGLKDKETIVRWSAAKGYVQQSVLIPSSKPKVLITSHPCCYMSFFTNTTPLKEFAL